MTEEKYTMSISLDVLRHLGIGLYSNVPAVLSEIVANAYDADASKVDITIDYSVGKIVVEDDGCGMATKEINERFLTVGYDKRKAEPLLTPVYNRAPMGRKGIGKLSVFAIANEIEVASTKNGNIDHFLMQTKDIQNQIATKKEYHPKALDTTSVSISKGTRIILRELKKDLGTDAYLRKRLAKRFSVISAENNFSVRINGVEISIQDRDFFPKIEFLWCLGDESKKYSTECAYLGKPAVIIGNVVSLEKNYKVSGWVGTVKDQQSIDENNNSIVLFARGKLIQEDILKDLKEGGLFTKYIIGEIEADFMDVNEEEDLITSDRQRVKEDDPRFQSLKEYVATILDQVQRDWTTFRNEVSEQKALTNPAIEEWYRRLKGDKRILAKSLFRKVESLKGIDDEGKKELYRASILAFEKLALKDSLSKLDLIQDEKDFKIIKSFFDNIDEVEAVMYHDIVKGRMAVIQKFENLISSTPTVKEKVLQEYLFDHLWLLSPSWERASTNPRIEEAVTREFAEITSKLTEDERRGRIDIRYRTAAGKHIIIELKRYDRAVTVTEILDQLGKYRSALIKCLENRFPEQPREIESIVILGSPPRILVNEEKDKDILREMNSRFITYDTLIQETLESYSEYFEKEKEITELLHIVENI